MNDPGKNKVSNQNIILNRKTGKTFFNLSVFFAVLTFIFLFFCVPAIQPKYNLCYRLIFITCILAVVTFLNIKFFKLLLNKQLFPIVLCIFTFSCFYLAGHGGWNSLLCFVRGLVFFVMAFVVAKEIRNFQIMIFICCVVLVFLFIAMLGGNPFSTNIVTDRITLWKNLANNMKYGITDINIIKEYMTYYLPYVSFIAVLSISFLDVSRKIWIKALVYGCYGMIFLLCLKTQLFHSSIW